jgi:hypothetical protein
LQVPVLHGDWAFALKFGELWAIPLVSQDPSALDMTLPGAALASALHIARRDGSGDRELLSLPGLGDLVVFGYP